MICAHCTSYVSILHNCNNCDFSFGKEDVLSKSRSILETHTGQATAAAAAAASEQVKAETSRLQEIGQNELPASIENLKSLVCAQWNCKSAQIFFWRLVLTQIWGDKHTKRKRRPNYQLILNKLCNNTMHMDQKWNHCGQTSSV